MNAAETVAHNCISETRAAFPGWDLLVDRVRLELVRARVLRLATLGTVEMDQAFLREIWAHINALQEEKMF